MAKWVAGTCLVGGAVALGLALCVIPFDFNVFVVPIVAVLALRTFATRSTRRARLRVAAFAGLTVATVSAIALATPPHHLQKIGPATYRDSTLSELMADLRSEFDVRCVLDPRVRDRHVDFFEIPAHTPRHVVLENLATQTGTRFRFGGYCANGMTVLFGSHPIMSWLEPPTVTAHSASSDLPAEPPSLFQREAAE